MIGEKYRRKLCRAEGKRLLGVVKDQSKLRVTQDTEKLDALEEKYDLMKLDVEALKEKA